LEDLQWNRFRVIKAGLGICQVTYQEGKKNKKIAASKVNRRSWDRVG
jgi:hypothetical protein